jgi:hypothetical protein
VHEISLRNQGSMTFHSYNEGYMKFYVENKSCVKIHSETEEVREISL